MCGILGWLGNHTQDDVRFFQSALDLLTHRGPDDSGVFKGEGVLFGHRRLSILDLSSSGHQPMRHRASGCVLVFNGEIYNYVEIARELKQLGHQLIGHSDTEVLLHALVEWGAAALPRLNGMWAFAFWSPRRKELLLARDRFGIKPLYYLNNKHGFAFASEPKSLLSLFPEHREVNENTLLEFLGNNSLYADNNSFYKDIYILPPSHCATFEVTSRSFRLSRYWDYPVVVNHKLTESEALAEFSNLFSDAVRLCLRSDVPVGITLSGGLDSTGVLAAASNAINLPISCFTSVYVDKTQGEFDWAEKASKAAKARLIPVTATQEEWLQTLRKIAWHMDAPGYSPAVYPLWHLMKRARAEGVLVLLEGQGADEALAGYPQYAILDLIDYLNGSSLRKPNLAGVIGRFCGLHRTFGLRWTLTWLARELSPRLLKWHRDRVGFRTLMLPGVRVPEQPNWSKIGDNDLACSRLQQDHSINILPGLLHYGDAVSMAHGIEARNPFLDYRLVEWMFKLPSHLRFNHNETKWVLREYLRANGQEVIGNRPDKKGFPTPVAQWLASQQGAEVETIMLAKDNPMLKWCDSVKIQNLINQNRKGVLTAEHHLYKLLSAQLWLQECLGRCAS